MIGVSELSKQYGTEEITDLSLKILCLIDKLHTFVNEWNLGKMSLIVDLRIDIKTKELMDITLSQKSCFT